MYLANIYASQEPEGRKSGDDFSDYSVAAEWEIQRVTDVKSCTKGGKRKSVQHSVCNDGTALKATEALRVDEVSHSNAKQNSSGSWHSPPASVSLSWRVDETWKQYKECTLPCQGDCLHMRTARTSSMSPHAAAPRKRRPQMSPQPCARVCSVVDLSVCP
jgi:hypothetical protein